MAPPRLAHPAPEVAISEICTPFREPSESDAGDGIRMSKRAAEDEELEAGKRTVRCACGAIDMGRISLCSPISLAGQRLPLPLAPAHSVS